MESISVCNKTRYKYPLANTMILISRKADINSKTGSVLPFPAAILNGKRDTQGNTRQENNKCDIFNQPGWKINPR